MAAWCHPKRSRSGLAQITRASSGSRRWSGDNPTQASNFCKSFFDLSSREWSAQNTTFCKKGNGLCTRTEDLLVADREAESATSYLFSTILHHLNSPNRPSPFIYTLSTLLPRSAIVYLLLSSSTPSLYIHSHFSTIPSCWPTFSQLPFPLLPSLPTRVLLATDTCDERKKSRWIQTALDSGVPILGCFFATGTCLERRKEKKTVWCKFCWTCYIKKKIIPMVSYCVARAITVQ